MVPQKASGRVGSGVGSYTTLQLVNIGIGVATFFFFLKPGVKLDEKSIENGLEGQKFLVVCLIWGGCHHPNIHLYNVVQSGHIRFPAFDTYKQ